MAKGNLLLGTAKGRIGDVVFVRRLGEQNTRAYNPKIKNPRTPAQMRNRLRLSNIVNGYKILAIPGSFQTEKAGQTNYNAFIKANLTHTDDNYLTLYATREVSLANRVLGNNFMISNGSLPSIRWQEVYHQDDLFINCRDYIDWQDEAVTQMSAIGYVVHEDIIPSSTKWNYNDLWPLVRNLLYPNVTNSVCDGIVITLDENYIDYFYFDTHPIEGDFILEQQHEITMNTENKYAIYSKSYASGIFLDVMPLGDDTSYIHISYAWTVPFFTEDYRMAHFCFQYQQQPDGSIFTSPSRLDLEEITSMFQGDEVMESEGEYGFQRALQSYNVGEVIDLRTGTEINP